MCVLWDGNFNNQTGRHRNKCAFKRSFCKNSRRETTFQCTLICLSVCKVGIAHNSILWKHYHYGCSIQLGKYNRNVAQFWAL